MNVDVFHSAEFVVEKMVMHKASGAVGVIVAVDNMFGMIKVQYIIPEKKVARYSTLDLNMLRRSLHLMTEVEVADFRLAQEKHGITDDWLE